MSRVSRVSRGSDEVTRSHLLGLGFQDLDRARAELAVLGPAGEPLLAILGRTADPDCALGGLVRLLDTDQRDDLLTCLVDDEGTAMRVLACSVPARPSPTT